VTPNKLQDVVASGTVDGMAELVVFVGTVSIVK
jgi:hypothetical protein